MNIDEFQLVDYANTMIERVNSWPELVPVHLT